MEPSYRANTHMGPPGFNQNPNLQNRNQNQPRMNQGYQNQGNFNPGQNQGFHNQGNFNRNNFNPGNHFQGNGNPNQGNFQPQQGYNQNNRVQNFPNQTQAILPTPQSSSDELLKQFMKTQEETNRLLVSQISEIKKSLNEQPSGSGKLPSNTIANPRGDAKAITTRSGVSYDGPTVPTTPSSSSPKVVENNVSHGSPLL